LDLVHHLKDKIILIHLLLTIFLIQTFREDLIITIHLDLIKILTMDLDSNLIVDLNNLMIFLNRLKNIFLVRHLNIICKIIIRSNNFRVKINLLKESINQIFRIIIKILQEVKILELNSKIKKQHRIYQYKHVEKENYMMYD
jgi:hypothetical protein